MIVLDTNVVSEAMRGLSADERVRAFLRRLRTRPVTTVINRAEVLAGLAVLPNGQTKRRLQTAATTAFGQLGVVLPLTDRCAEHFADITAARRAMGRPIAAMDALIASIVRESAATLATRNLADFSGLGLDLVDPWAR
ncbi:MAG: type II toxin-antitoxin system VapC family toxin [Nocardioides sp.]|uniref:type II toxin-antitoxin system VapC family toxin n=1 Tax=Nocardioides sp. TaxID=35761 RepID=UPI0039E3A37A